MLAFPCAQHAGIWWDEMKLLAVHSSQLHAGPLFSAVQGQTSDPPAACSPPLLSLAGQTSHSLLYYLPKPAIMVRLPMGAGRLASEHEVTIHIGLELQPRMRKFRVPCFLSFVPDYAARLLRLVKFTCAAHDNKQTELQLQLAAEVSILAASSTPLSVILHA